LYSPRNILSNFGGPRSDEAKSWYNLNGSLYLPEAHQKKISLVNKFSELLERAEKNGLRISSKLELAPSFLQQVIYRDFFFNLRDYAMAYKGLIKHGILYRGPTITRWKGTKELDEFITKSKISCIIDLREDSELNINNGKLSYDSQTLENINYVRTPVGETKTKSGVSNEYINVFLYNIDSYINAFTALATWHEPCLIHCHVGKDRTGIFCAILAQLLDLPKESIVFDYVLSEQGVKPEKILSFINHVESLGGAKNVLLQRGMDDSIIRKLIIKLSNR
jgi:hypothetical protein